MHAADGLAGMTQSIMASGGLVSDQVVNEMLAERIGSQDCSGGFLLDGYPRTVEQAAFLDGMLSSRGLPAATVLHLDVPEDALIGRMTSRRECPQCSRIYNLLHEPPESPGICDDDGARLITRKDDREHVVRARLRTYDDITRPVLAYYHNQNYHQIKGDRSPSYIFEAITSILEKVVNGNS